MQCASSMSHRFALSLFSYSKHCILSNLHTSFLQPSMFPVNGGSHPLIPILYFINGSIHSWWQSSIPPYIPLMAALHNVSFITFLLTHLPYLQCPWPFHLLHQTCSFQNLIPTLLSKHPWISFKPFPHYDPFTCALIFLLSWSTLEFHLNNFLIAIHLLAPSFFSFPPII